MGGDRLNVNRGMGPPGGAPQGGAGGAQHRAFAGRGVRLGGMWFQTYVIIV